MAMTKKERERIDALIEHYATQAALSWTALVPPDVPVPTGFQEASTGWRAINRQYGGIEVQAMWSESHAHGTGAKRSGSGSQHGKALHSTPLLALKALRNDVEQECAKQLRRIDKAIDAELAKGE